MDKSIQMLPIFPIYFILNYEFSKNYSEVNSCPTLIIFELTQIELKEIILCNCNIVKYDKLFENTQVKHKTEFISS